MTHSAGESHQRTTNSGLFQNPLQSGIFDTQGFER
jgi:hypothetical protein